jgi:hypothetical protein
MAVPRPTLAAATPSVARLPSFSANKPMGMMPTKAAVMGALADPLAGARAGVGALANTARRKKTAIGEFSG